MRRSIDFWSPWILTALVVVGLFVRLIHIGIMPPGLTTDEAAITYDAWGISINGTDQWGQRWPLIFTSLGDGKLPLTHYLLAVGFACFGFHIYGIRVLTAFIGVILIAGVYFLAKKHFPHKQSVWIISAFLTTFSPWTIHFSRFGLEAGIALTLMVWGLVHLYRHRILGTLLMVAAIYTYHSSLIVVPVMFIFMILTQQKMSRINKIILALLFGLLLVPLILAEFQVGWTRASQTIALPSTVIGIGKRVLAQFSPAFWLWGKQSNFRQAIPGSFVLLIAELPLLLTGIMTSFRLSKTTKWLFGIWLVVGLIPSLIGNPSPHTIRAFHIAPLIFILEAMGVVAIARRWRHLLWGFITGYIVCWVVFWSNYTGPYVSQSAKDFGYGYSEVMTILKQEGRVAPSFVISPFLEQPYIYTLLYWQIKPSEYRAGALANMIYRPIRWPEQQNGTLYAGSAQEIPVTDPRVIFIVPYPHTTQPLWVIAR